MFINNLNPIIFQSNFVSIRWYGVLVALGITLAVIIIVQLFKKKGWNSDQALDLCIWLIVGGLIGARLGEVFFYSFSYYLQNPVEIFFINHGGLSSHGMTIGLLVTFFIYGYFKKIDLLAVADILVIAIPILAGFIRLGNFFNSEILGRVTTSSLGVYFPRMEVVPLLRHPVVLYEMLFAWVLFIVLYIVYKKCSNVWHSGLVFNLFLFLYFSIRFLLEFFKEHQTSWEGILTAGQWLSLPFIIFSIPLFFWIKKRKT